MDYSVGKTAKNAGWLIGGKVAEMVISFIVSIFVIRYLGTADTGLLEYGLAYPAFFTAICTLGINSVLVKEFVDGEDAGTVLGTTLVLRTIATVLSVITILCIVLIANFNEPLTLLVVFLASLRLVFQIFDSFSYWFHAQLKSKYTAVILLVAYLLTTLYRIVLLLLGEGVVAFAVGVSVDHACIALLLVICYFAQGGKKLRFSGAYAKKLLKKSWHFVLPSLMVAIYSQTDKLMLDWMMGSEELAFYSVASKVCTIWVFVLAAIIDSVNPSVMQAKKEGDNALYDKRNKQLYSIVFYVSIFVSLCFCVFADLVIYVLYGVEFAPAALPLRIITWYTAFSYLGVARGAWIICEEKQKYLIWVYVGAAAVNVIANLALIPLLGGAGAALASLLAQVATSFIVPMCIPALRPNAKLMWEAILLKGVLSDKAKKRILAFLKITGVYLLAIGMGVMVAWVLPFDLWLSILIGDIVATIVVFLYSLLFSNASVYDPYWSVQPIVIVGCCVVARPFSLTWLLPLVAICLWGIRLTANWAYTFKGMDHQDWRYTHYQQKTGKLYPVVNFFGIHLMPTLIVYACTLPVVFLIDKGVDFSWLALPFIALSLFATVWQGLADYQMHKFRKKVGHGFMRFGLWRYSRHPNYLGEILMWWGIGGYAAFLMPSHWWLLAGALVNTLLFLCVSIPLADGRQAKKEGFAEYKAQTRALLPIPKARKSK